MKNILLFISLLFCANIAAQHNPTPQNPWKWYTVKKDTSIKGVEVTEFQVMFQASTDYYKEFEVDSLGNMISYPITSTVSFREYFNRDAAIESFDDNCLKKFAHTFVYIVFEAECVCENNVVVKKDIGITDMVNWYLAGKYGVPFENIIE